MRCDGRVTGEGRVIGVPKFHAPCFHATPRFYLAAVEKNREKAWYQYYITDQKWWTRFYNDANVPTHEASTTSDQTVKFV